MRLVVLARARGDRDRLAGGEQAVHARGADADALLAAALLQAVELRAVEQAAEDLRHLLAHDARAVVLDRDPEARLGDLARSRRARRAGCRASSQASSELSTASFTVVSSAFDGLSKPSRWRFFAKNSETEMSRACLASSAAERRGAERSTLWASLALRASLRAALRARLRLRAGLRARCFALRSLRSPAGGCAARADASRGTDSSHSPIRTHPRPARGDRSPDPLDSPSPRAGCQGRGGRGAGPIYSKSSIGALRKLPHSRTSPLRSMWRIVATTSRSSRVTSLTARTSASSVVTRASRWAGACSWVSERRRRA